MNARQDETLVALRRVQDYLDANQATLGSVNASGTRTDLNTAVTSLTALAISQKQGTEQARGETSHQRTLRRTLLQTHMAPIAAIAKAKLATVPNFSSLKLPKPTIRTQALLTAAGSMGNTATPYAATFVAQGLAPTFVADMATAAANLEASLGGRDALKNGSVSATSGVAAAVKNAHAVLKVLNTMVVPLVESDATLLKGWKQAKKVIIKNPAAPAAATPAVTTVATPTSTPTPTPSPTPTPAEATTAPPVATASTAPAAPAAEKAA